MSFHTCRTLLLLLVLTGCASLQASLPESLSFAPSLGVDLEAMEQHSSGVYIRDVTIGEGEPVRHGERIAVHYVGWLPDGTQFAGLAPPSDPIELRLGMGEVIRGWDEGIPGMRVGGQRMLVVPSQLAYGSSRTGEIPPNSVLVFVVELSARR